MISVNVIEHTADPRSFLRHLGAARSPEGRVVVICPDGSTPGVELLIADHHFSFASGHLRVLLSGAGLAVDLIEHAPAPLGAFQMAVARAGTSPVPTRRGDPRAAIQAHDAYLRQWACLDRRLEPRLASSAVCFGIGEAASLLRAYTPTVWQRIHACTADEIGESLRFATLPVLALDRVPPEETVLVAVRPQDQARVADRLRERFADVVVLHDLLDRPEP